MNKNEARNITIENFKLYFDKLLTGLRKIQEGDKDWDREKVDRDAEVCKEIVELLGTEAVVQVVYSTYCNEQFRAAEVQLKNFFGLVDSGSRHLTNLLPELDLHFPVIIQACQEKLRTELREVYVRQETFPVVRNAINCYCVCKELSLEPPIMIRAAEEVVLSHLLHMLERDITYMLVGIWKENPRPLVDKLIRAEELDLKRLKLRVQKIVDQVATRSSADSFGFLGNLSTEAKVWGLVPAYTGAQLAQVTLPYVKDVHAEMMDNNGPYWGLSDAVENNLPRVLSLANKLVPKSEHVNFVLELAKLIQPVFSDFYATWLAGLMKGLNLDSKLVYEFQLSEEQKENLAVELGGPDNLVQQKKKKDKDEANLRAQKSQEERARWEKSSQAEKERLKEALYLLKDKDV